MRKTIGPVVVIDTQPPYREWDGNQATLLFFPVFASFVLTLLSGLSEPIIGGLNMVKVDTGVNGTMSFGTWGFCVKGAPGVDDFCSGDRGFGGNLTDLDRLPTGMISLKEIVHVLPASYLIATGVFHLLGALATWLTVTWTLAASGAWYHKEVNGWNWTRWSFHGTGISSVFILIAWALDIGMVTRVAKDAVNVDGSQPSVKPGPAIWMMMTSFTLCLFTYIFRIVCSRRFPRPQWTFRGASDFHINPLPPPLSAALPPPQDHPPTWESLNLHTPGPNAHNQAVHGGYTAEEEKQAIEVMQMERDHELALQRGQGGRRMGDLGLALEERDKPSVEQRGFQF